MAAPVIVAKRVTWEDMLTRMDEALGQAVTEVQAREDALPAAPQETPATPQRRQEFQAFQERLRGLEERTQAAAQAMAEVDAVLQEGESILRNYLSASEGMRQRLADWAGRAIG